MESVSQRVGFSGSGVRVSSSSRPIIMGEELENHSTKHKRSNEKDGERKTKKRHKHDHSSRNKRRRDDEKLQIVDDDPNDDEMWVEKNIDMDGERVRTLNYLGSDFVYLICNHFCRTQPLATTIPTAESLKLTSSAVASATDPALPITLTTETALKRDEWMLMPSSSLTFPGNESSIKLPPGDEPLTEEYGEPGSGLRTLGGGVDFFASLGTDLRKKKSQPDRPDPDKVRFQY